MCPAQALTEMVEEDRLQPSKIRILVAEIKAQNLVSLGREGGSPARRDSVRLPGEGGISAGCCKEQGGLQQEKREAGNSRLRVQKAWSLSVWAVSCGS